MFRAVGIRNEITEKRKVVSVVDFLCFVVTDIKPITTKDTKVHEGKPRPGTHMAPRARPPFLLDLSLIDQTNCLQRCRADDLQAIRAEFVDRVVAGVMEDVVVAVIKINQIC